MPLRLEHCEDPHNGYSRLALERMLAFNNFTLGKKTRRGEREKIQPASRGAE
jgi:hypothetical protein